MRRNVNVGLGVALVVLSIASGAWAQGRIDEFKLLRFDRAAFRAAPVAMLPADNQSGVGVVYGDRYGLVRVVRVTDQGVREIWRSRILEGGEVAQVLVADLDGNGGTDIVVRTTGGNIFVFDDNFTARWESVNEGLRNVSAMALANVDEDEAYEIILFADQQILYVDGSAFNREYQSTQTYRGGVREMLVGNVDNDIEYEIVLNTGVVIDAINGEPEWETEVFGNSIELVDIDGDGLQEVLGYNSATEFMRIFDVDTQEEKPLQ